MRTALSFVAFGFVVARFSLFTREFSVIAHQQMPSSGISTIFGMAMAAIGALVALFGSRRYMVARAAIEHSTSAPLSSRVAGAVGLTLTAIGLVVAAALFYFK